MKTGNTFMTGLGVVLCALALGSAYGGTKWGEAWAGGAKRQDLDQRTGSEGAYLDTEDLAADVNEIRFVAGEILVDHIAIDDGRSIAFVGDASGTTLKPDPQAYGQDGGAISVTGGKLSVKGIVFSGFYSETAGGAIALWEATDDSSLSQCQFVNCRASFASGAGGAVYASAAAGRSVTLKVENCSFAGCEAANGGAITTERIYPYKEKAMALSVTGCSFRADKANYSGGAIWNEGNLTIGTTTFTGCQAAANGGAVCSGSTDITFAGLTLNLLPGVRFDGNAATDVYSTGGALALMSSGIGLTGARAAFLANASDCAGGAVFACAGSTVSLTTSVFSNNVVKAANDPSLGYGGALSVEESRCALTNLTVRGSNGGAVDFYCTDAEVVNCVAIGNDDCDISSTSSGGRAPSLALNHTAYGALSCDPSVVQTAHQCLAGRTVADYDGASLYLKGTPDYNPVAAEGLVQQSTDFDGVKYGSRPFGYSMGAFECATASCVSSEPFTGVYDGNGHTITVAVATSVLDVKWRFSTASAKGPWVDYNPAFTNVGSYWVWACASTDQFGTSMVTSNTVTITRRAIELKSASAEKTYDGAPLTTNDVWVVGSGEQGLAAGDKLTFACQGTQTVVGSSDNVFTYGMTNGRGETVTDNYSVTKNPGTLLVVAAPMPPPDHDPDPVGPNYPPSAGPFDGPDLPPGQVPPLPVDPAGGDTIKLSDYDVVTVYDGKPHTFDEAVLTAKLDGYKRDGKFHGNDYTVEYSLTGVQGSWQSQPHAFVDVAETPTSFWYRVSVPNFTNYIHAVGVTITQRVVQVTSGTESWVYTGKPHSNTTVRVTGGSFADGEGVGGSDFATIQDVGTCSNTFTVSWTAADPSNYRLTALTGALTVTPRPEGPMINTVTDVFYYDADAKEPKPGVTDMVGGQIIDLIEGKDFDYSWSDNVNASDAAKLIVTLKGNYSGVLTNDFTILPRSVTLTSGTETWVYDNCPHANETVTATAYAAPNFGFVPGEGVTTSQFAVVTAATDNAPNTFRWDWLPPTLAQNYIVSVAEGRLTVLAAPMPPPDHDPDPVGPNYPPSAGPFDGPNLSPGQVPPVPVDPAGDTITLSDYDVVTVYDGQPHTFNEAALIARLDAYKAAGRFYGNDYTLEYSLTGVLGSWRSEPYSFTDVDETPASFWYRVSVPNFTNSIHAVGVTITQRVVVVEFPTAEKTYDGTVDYAGVLATNVVYGTHNMVAGEAFYGEARGRFADPSVGTPNFIITNVAFRALNAATKFSNYKIYFGAQGKVLFNPDSGEAPGPVPFGPDDPNWPSEPEDQPVAPGNIGRGTISVEAFGSLRGYDGIHTNIQVIVNGGAEIGGWYRILYAPDLAIPASDYTRGSRTGSGSSADGASGRPADDSELWSEAMPQFKNVATNGYEGAYRRYGFDGTNGSYIVWYRVQFENYEEISGFAAVTVIPRRVEFAFPKVVKKFDGDDTLPASLPEGVIETNLLRTTGHNMVGDEKFTAYGTGKFSQSSVGDSAIYLELTRILTTADNGAEDRNYRKVYCVLAEDGTLIPIGVLGVNADGETTIEGRVISEESPIGSSAAITPADENPDDDPHPAPKKEDQPDGKTPKPAPQPTVDLSAYDTTNVYDAAGHTLDTNELWQSVLGPYSKYIIAEGDRDKVKFDYSLDGMSWSADPLMFTNAVTTSFWYRVCVPNYETNCHPVAVTILKRRLHLRANFQSMVYDDPTTLAPGFDVPAAWDENPIDDPDANLLDGDGLRTVCLTFDRPYADYRPGETNVGVIVTNLAAAATNATRSVFVVTNALGDVTRNYALEAFEPGDLWVEENLALFKASLKWMYVSDSFVAQLTIENTNRTARFKYEAGSMRFCLADRTDATYGSVKLWDWKAYRAQEPVESNGRAFYLADPVGGWQPGASVVFGPSTATTDVAAGFGYIGKSPYVWVENRLAPIDDCVGSLVWVSDGKEITIPLAANEELVRQTPMVVKSLYSAPSPTAEEEDDGEPRFETEAVEETLYRYVAVSNVIRTLGTQGGKVTLKKVSGALPSGLAVKYDAAAAAMIIVGVPTATDKTGTKSFVATYQIVETRKESGKTVKVVGRTVRLAYAVVDPAVAAAGSSSALNDYFIKSRTYADMPVVDEAHSTLVGVLTLTVPRTGKASAKLACAAGKLSFAATSWSDITSEGVLGLRLRCTTAGHREAALTVRADRSGLTALSIEGLGETAWMVVAGTLWSQTHAADAWKGTYTVALPRAEVLDDPLDYAPGGAVTLSLKMTAAQTKTGKMTWSGTLADGTTISGSSVLTEGTGDGVWLPVFVATKKDVFGAVVALNADGCSAADVAANPYWQHTENSKALPEAGFRVRYGLCGGAYVVPDLGASAVSLDIHSVTSVTLVVSGGKLMLQKDQPNPCKVKMSVNAAGVVSGSFALPLGDGAKSVSAKFSGVVLPGWSGEGDATRPLLLGAWSYADKMGYDGGNGVIRYQTVRRGDEISVYGSEGK